MNIYSESRPGCKAYQMSDQKCCDRCGLVWDMNDPEPPTCLTEQEAQDRVNRRGMAKLRESMKDE